MASSRSPTRRFASRWAGGAVSALALVYGLTVIVRWALGDPSLERGWSSTIVVIAGLGGANMLMTGVIGLYVGRIHAEVKRRPLYIVERAIGFDEAPNVPADAVQSRSLDGRPRGRPADRVGRAQRTRLQG
jgi:polyisoprenyl-phosphate glycosyltransferase